MNKNDRSGRLFAEFDPDRYGLQGLLTRTRPLHIFSAVSEQLDDQRDRLLGTLFVRHVAAVLDDVQRRSIDGLVQLTSNR